MTDESTEVKELLRTPYDIVRHVDMTPDSDLPLRILEAYITNCKVLFNLENIDEESKELCKFLNENAEQGGKLLEKALQFLRDNKDKWSV